METITKEKFINALREKSTLLFNWEDIFKIFSLNLISAKALLGRLKQRKIIQQLSRKKYLFLLGKKIPEDFEIANFIYTPSYISLESALSIYGIIDQFSYKITSITLRKTKEFKINDKNYTYHHIKQDFFQDYRKEGGYLIASPEKAVFDYLYLIYKGGRAKSSLSLLRIEENIIKRRILSQRIQKLAHGKDDKFISFCKNQKII